MIFSKGNTSLLLYIGNNTQSKTLSKRCFYQSYIRVFHLYVYPCTTVVWCPWRPEQGIRCLGLELQMAVDSYVRAVNQTRSDWVGVAKNILVEHWRIRVDNVWKVHCALLHLRWALYYFCCLYAGFLHWLKVSALNHWTIFFQLPSPSPTSPTFKERLGSELELLYVPNIRGWISKWNSNERSGGKDLCFHIRMPPLPGGEGGQI